MMSSRKRLPDTRSGGASPPDKRPCPPQRSASTSQHDSHGLTRGPASSRTPPGSRGSPTTTTTTTTTTKATRIPAGPRLDPYKPVPPSHDASTISPRSITSGASTPINQTAPTVPSMLPQATENTHPTLPTTHAGTKLSMDSLRDVQSKKVLMNLTRKRSTASTDSVPPAALDFVHKATIEANQIELAYLRKERDAMAERLEKLERQNKPNLPEQFQAALDRITALEQFKTQFGPPEQRQELQKVVEELQAANKTMRASVKELVNQQVNEQAEIMNKTVQASIKECMEKNEMTNKTMRDSFTITKASLTKRCEQSSKTIEEISANLADLFRLIEKSDGKIGFLFQETQSLFDKQSEFRQQVAENQASLGKADQQTHKMVADRIDEHDRLLKNIQRNMGSFGSAIEKVEKVTEDRLSEFSAIVSQAKELPVLENQQSKLPTPLSQTATISDTKLGQLEAVIATFQEQLAALDSDFLKTEEKVHSQGLQLDYLKQHVPELFARKFDPLQEELKQALNSVREDGKVQAAEMAAIKDELSTLRINQAMGNADPMAKDAMALLRQDIEQLQVDALEEKRWRGEHSNMVDRRLIAKADTDAMNKQMEAFRLTLRNLHDQYANITTEDLHQKMVRWFLQMYPHNAAELVQEVVAIKQDIVRLRSATNTATVMTNDITVKLDAQKQQSDSIEAAVTGLQTSLHNLNSASSPFARSTTIDSLRTSFNELEARFNASPSEGFQDAQRMEGKFNQLRAEFEKISDSFIPFQNEFKVVNDSFIQPNRLLLPYLALLFGFSLEVQTHLESVNIDTEKPFQHKFTCDLKRVMAGKITDSGGNSNNNSDNSDINNISNSDSNSNSEGTPSSKGQLSRS